MKGATHVRATIAALLRRPRSSTQAFERVDKMGGGRQNAALFRTPAAGARVPLANIKSAEKRARQTTKRREHNVMLRSKMRTAVKKVRAAVATGEKDAARAAYQAAVPVIDSMVNKGIVHRNAAARHKSRLAAVVKALAQKA